MIHVKAMTVDEEFAMPGTANFDIRSFYLNFELNLLSYDADLNGLLRFYETRCIKESEEVELSTWRARGPAQRWGPSSPNYSARFCEQLSDTSRPASAAGPTSPAWA
jgi:phosphatidylserine/phosphatidylglycerophosphate/cardiolipin synthase-like enzyme